jgi:simple sugar transport system ATP-binding protein
MSHSTPPPSISASPLVCGAHLSKAFGATTALRDVTLEVHAGEVRALVGRNGAGKSTLVSILTGMIEPDGGTIHFCGEPAPAGRAREQWQTKVACVYQHPKIVPTLSCAENLFLSENQRKRGLVSWRAMRREARATLERWGLQIDVEALAGTLSVGERQLLEIARAMIQGSRFLILDEPTAKLNAREVDRLFAQIRALQSMGVGILFISHHLDEVFEIGQSVTVLRDGRKVLDRAILGLQSAELIDAMVGPQSQAATARATPVASSTGAAGTAVVSGTGAAVPAPQRVDFSSAEVRLSVGNLSCRGAFDAVTFQVHAGECVGLAGLTGAGKEAIGECLAGLRRWDGGSVRLGDNDRGYTELPGGDVYAHNRAGVGFVPEDRHRQGLVLGMSVAENATMAIPDQLGLFGFLSPRALSAVSTRLIDRLGIKTSGPDEIVSSLSGGNQQKVVLARALARDPKVLVLINPTSGVDVASKAALFASIAEVGKRGAAVVIISDEIEELELCDRVLVVRGRRLTREFHVPWVPREMVAEMEGA